MTTKKDIDRGNSRWKVSAQNSMQHKMKFTGLDAYYTGRDKK
ncbi:hypothetical protein [Georgfuchsia toluolica]|nr:hypothetical protein [Georgfuchsia toluolica]